MTISGAAAEVRKGPPRRFDHDECRALYATGEWSQSALARKYGVTQVRISQLVNPEHMARVRENQRRYQSGVCIECGEPCSWNRYQQDFPTCKDCAGFLRRQRFEYDADGALLRIQCVTCKEWQPPGAYARDKNRPENRHQQCRQCSTIARREYRHRHLEEARAYDRARYARLKKARLDGANR